MNPNFHYAMVTARMRSLQAETDTMSWARREARIRRGTARARLARRSRRWLSFAPAGSGR